MSDAWNNVEQDYQNEARELRAEIERL